MQYTEKQLTEAEKLATLGFSKKEIKIIISDTLRNLDYAIQKGRLMGEYKIRKANYDLAMAGSSPAIAKHFQLLEMAKINDTLEN